MAKEKKEEKREPLPVTQSDLLELGLEHNLDSVEAVAERRAKKE